MIQISAIPIPLLGQVWNQVAPLLQKVVDESHGDITLASTKNRLMRGEAWLLAVSDGPEIIAAITAEVLVVESGKRILMVPMVGGSRMDEWLDLLHDQLKQIKQESLCDEIRGAGRPGWVRALKSKGWKPAITIVTFEG